MSKYKLENVLNLLQIAEQGFIYKLKKKNPDITEPEVKAKLAEWYLHRPGAEHGDGNGTPGDISLFDKERSLNTQQDAPE